MGLGIPGITIQNLPIELFRRRSAPGPVVGHPLVDQCTRININHGAVIGMEIYHGK